MSPFPKHHFENYCPNLRPVQCSGSEVDGPSGFLDEGVPNRHLTYVLHKWNQIDLFHLATVYAGGDKEGDKGGSSEAPHLEKQRL